MKLLIKKLQGGECTVEVQPSTTIAAVKKLVAEKLCIPTEEQKLLLLGRTLVDEQTVQSYPTLKDGSKLNLIVKKPEGLYDAAYRTFKRCGISDTDASAKAKRFVHLIEEKLKNFSWDDLERLAADCLRHENLLKEQRNNIPQ